MSTKRNKRAVIVGIFILVGLSFLVAIILLIGGQRKAFSRTLLVHAVFDEVSGLQQGNNIWLSGVKVGTVRKIAFNEQSKVVVSMSILESMQPYIHKDATAKIGSESLIGNKIVVLTQGTPRAPLIQSGDRLATLVPLNTEEMMTTLQKNNTNLLAITSDLKEVTRKLSSGEGSLGKILHDEELVRTLQATLNKLNAASGQAHAFTSDLSAYTSRLQSKGSLTNDLVTDTVIFGRLRHTAVQLQEIAHSAQAAMNHLKEASSEVNAGLNGTASPLGVLINDEKAAEDFKTTLNNLRQGSQKLDENLEALQHNFLFRGFFRKKQKKEAEE